MKQEDKELLLKELYARLPYRIKFKANDEECIREIHYIKDEDVYIREYRNLSYWIDTIKPYLRPMSSMTKEEVKEFYDVECMDAKVGYIKPTWNWHFTINGIDWLLEHHFDYRGLIEKGLALEAPEGMYK